MSFSVALFYKAFSSAPRPRPDEITTHRCCECDKVRDDFSAYAVTEVPDEILRYHGDSIPFLSPKAFRYYLPRYIQFTCENPNENATDNLLFNISPDNPFSEFWSGRCDNFTTEERRAIIAYLEHRRTWPDSDVDKELITSGLEYWNDE
jgi:hypothetical protein